MRTALKSLNSAGALPLASQKTFEGYEEIRAQTSLLAADRVQISMFKQTRKKFLNQILCLFSCNALPPGKSVEWSPISAAEYVECLLRSGRFALRLQHYAPMSRGKRQSATIGAFDSG